MSDTHVIRLRSPWSQQASGEGVSWSRRFNSPTGLDGSQQVWIVIDDMPASGTALVNGHPLGPLAPRQVHEFDITDILTLHNHVCLNLSLTSQTISSIPDPQSVQLEIRTLE